MSQTPLLGATAGPGGHTVTRGAQALGHKQHEAGRHFLTVAQLAARALGGEVQHALAINGPLQPGKDPNRCSALILGELDTSKSNSTLVAVRLTFCPPGPTGERVTKAQFREGNVHLVVDPQDIVSRVVLLRVASSHRPHLPHGAREKHAAVPVGSVISRRFCPTPAEV